MPLHVVVNALAVAHLAALVAVPPDPLRGEEPGHLSRLSTAAAVVARLAAAMLWQLARYSCVKVPYSLCDDEGAAPAARRPVIRSHVYVQIRFESGATVLGGRPLRRRNLTHWLSVPHLVGAVEPESDREPYDKARVEIRAYPGLRRLLL